MRKRLMVLVMTVLMVLMSASPAMARAGLKPPQPAYPPGLDRGQDEGPGSPAHKEEARGDHARTPLTGRLNTIYHGKCDNPLYGPTTC